MKIFKSKNFKALIYSIFLSLPILTILGRTIYSIANKNAKDSYYGETINETKLVQTDIINYQNGKTYILNNTNFVEYSENINAFRIEVYNFKLNNVLYENVSNLVVYSSNYKYYMECRNENNTSDVGLNFTNNTYYVEFVYLTNNNITQFNIFNNVFKNYSFTYEYNKYSYLDNAFEYSIDRFVQENNYGKLNFFQWFSDLFLNNNQTNNLYIHFINWYMNYILYVSLAYLLFAVLMWFVNFFRSLVEKNMDLDL